MVQVSTNSLALVAPESRVGGWTVRDVYVQNASFLWRALQRVGVPEGDLDDCLQEVLLVVHRRLNSFDPARAKLTTWLFGICLRVARRHRRRSQSRAKVGEGRAPEPVTPHSPEDELDRAELRGIVARALDALDTDKRATLVLFEVEGMKTEAIAELMGVPIGTVHSRLHAARKQLLRKLRTDVRWRERPDSGQQGADQGASLTPAVLLGLLPLAAPMPHQAYVRGLAQATRLAMTPGGSLLALLGGKAVVLLVPAGLVCTLLVAGRPSGSAAVAELPAASGAPQAPGAAPQAGSLPPLSPPEPPLTVPAPPRVTRTATPTAPPSQRRPTARPSAALSPPSLAAEAGLVADARRRLVRDPAAALELTREYARRFPTGQLRSANECVAVEALARLGRGEDARRTAQVLSERDPRGAYSVPARDTAERMRQATPE